MISRSLTKLAAGLMLMSTSIAFGFDESQMRRADEFIATAIGQKNIPGAVLLAGTSEGIVFSKAYGNRAVQPSAEPMTEDTIFDLASLSKPIGCATSVLILADQGKIKLADPVAKYLPEFGNNGKEKITIEMLLLHRGGLIPDNPMSDYAGTAEESIAKVMRLKPTSEPGTKFAYTDVGFIVLGELVKKVSGKPLEEFAKEQIFTPLGMKDTSYLPPKSWAARTAPTEKRKGQWMRGEVHDPRAYALGGVAGHAGLFGTAADVGRWVRMLLNDGELDGKRILSSEMVRQMLTMRALPDGKGARGYGVDIDSSYAGVRGDRYEKGTTFGHTGWTGTMFWADPVNNVFHVLLTNRVHPDGKGEVKQVRKAVSNVVAEALLGPVPGPAADGGSILASPDGRRNATGAPANVLNGIDVLKRDDFAPLKGKKIAIVTNHTGRDRDGNHLVDLLTKADGVTIVRLFSPEHGLYGTLDEHVGHGKDEKTGLQVYSLYGKTRKPNKEMLKGVDTLVFDIQDVGARFYTYSATMGLCMEAAKENGIAIYVLDRPNPITGLIVDGPIADKDMLGFTAFRQIPVSHGMTFGELAEMFNKEFGGIGADLHVVKAENWTRDMWFDETGQMWINPSPNMRNLTQATLYTAVCLLEATNVSVGRGTDQPFEIFGAPWIDGKKLSAALNESKLPGLRFVPITFTPAKGSKLGEQKCEGVYILVTDRNALEPVRSGLTMAHHLHKLFVDKFEVDKVVRLLQNKKTLEALKTIDDAAKLPAVWKDELETFKTLREKYLIYK